MEHHEMVQKAFGGTHTIEKLDKLEAYLKAFLTAFRNQNWAHTIYFDAFAGTGDVPLKKRERELPLDDGERDFIAGSVKRALALELSFNEYVFVEKNAVRADSLRDSLRQNYAARFDRISVRTSDANTELLQLCATKDWSTCRAVVFLDPFGSQVEWSTITALAATKAVDLWYLFPAGLSVHRQISRDGTVHYTHEESITRLFGTNEWRTAFIDVQPSEPDLFGHSQSTTTKTATPTSVTAFMIKRMMMAFDGGVLDEWLPLGRNQGHWYSLIFACANPRPKARALALRLARAVIRSGQHGRAK